MLIRLENPALLSKAIDVISELVTEVRIKLNEFGLSIVALDPANVAMVGFKIPRSAFSQFEAGNETIGVSLDSLKHILKRCSTKSSLILEQKENVLNIRIEDRIKRNFSIGLIEIESEEKEIPDLEYSAMIELNPNDFIASVEDCLIVADACSFIVKEKKFLIEAKGINSARSEFSEDEAKIQAEDCKSRYSLEYLQKFMKGAKLCDKIKLRFASDHPLRVDLRGEHLELIFILAPRVETED